MKYTDTPGGVIVSENASFDRLLKDACDRLWDKKVALTLRRIGKLENSLDLAEQELNEFIAQGNSRDTAAGSFTNFGTENDDL